MCGKLLTPFHLCKSFQRNIIRTVMSFPKSCDFDTLVFFDIETTGLPSGEWGRTRITELSLCAARVCDLRRVQNGPLGRIPRIINKINLCLNPQKVICKEATDVSGLSNELLECYGGFDEKIFTIMENFFHHLPSGPVCLLSHNGNKFDFPILASELKAIGKWFSSDHEILCADTFVFFRELYGVSKVKKNLFGGAGTSSNVSTTVIPSEIDGIQPLHPEPNLSKNTNAASAEMNVISVDSVYWHALSDEWDADLIELTEQIERQYVTQTPTHQRIPEPTQPPHAPRVRRVRPVRENKFPQSMQEINETTPPRPIVKDENKPKSFRLVDIYTHVTQNPEPPNLHSAEADCLALMQSVACSLQEILVWLQTNAVPFDKYK